MQKSKLLIMMKGHPGCGKSTVSRALARALRCPVVDKDDVRDCTVELECPCTLACTCSNSSVGSLESADRVPNKFTPKKMELELECPCTLACTCSNSSVGSLESANRVPNKFTPKKMELELECPCTLACTCSNSSVGSLESADRVPNKFTPNKMNALSYMVMWRVVETQLDLGIDVIVDCPLAREELFQKAVALAHRFGYTLVVMECLPGNKEEWRMRFETRAGFNPPSSLRDKEDPQISTNEEEQLQETSHIVNSQPQTAVEALKVQPMRVMKRWHKPSKWTDLQNLLTDYAGCYEYDTSTVKKIILDTTAAPTHTLVEATLQCLASLKSMTNLVTYYPSREEN